jgi:hypothetical protein
MSAVLAASMKGWMEAAAKEVHVQFRSFVSTCALLTCAPADDGHCPVGAANLSPSLLEDRLCGVSRLWLWCIAARGTACTEICLTSVAMMALVHYDSYI